MISLSPAREKMGEFFLLPPLKLLFERSASLFSLFDDQSALSLVRFPCEIGLIEDMISLSHD